MTRSGVTGVPANVPAKTGYMPSLDGWRAVAIFAVLCNHDPDGHSIAFLGTKRLHEVGWAGVDLFFAISGLLICSRLLEEERLNGRISMRGFYTRRVFRILPAAYAFLAVCLALGFAHQIPYSIPATLASVLMIRNYWGVFSGVQPNELYTDHFWSLSVEEHFYLILPAVLVFVRRRILFLSVLSAAAFSWFLYFARHEGGGPNFSYTRTDLHVHGMLFPAVLALILAKPAARELAVKWMKPWFWICVGCVLAFAIHNLPPGYRFGIVGIYFPFLVISTLVHPASLTCRMLEWKPVRYVGRLSYGIYLWQQIFVLRSKATREPFLVLQHFPWNYLALAVCVIASYYLLEKPLIALGHRLAPPATPGHADLKEGPEKAAADAKEPGSIVAGDLQTASTRTQL